MTLAENLLQVEMGPMNKALKLVAMAAGAIAVQLAGGAVLPGGQAGAVAVGAGIALRVLVAGLRARQNLSNAGTPFAAIARAPSGLRARAR